MAVNNLGRGNLLRNYKPKPKPLGPTNLGRGNILVNYHPAKPGTAPVRPPAPQAPAAPLGSPPDPQLEAWKASQALNLNLSAADATYQRGDMAQEYGYNATGARDYSNPYSRAALLQDTYLRSKRGSENSYAAMGQLNSGAYGRQVNETARQYDMGSDRLQRDAAGSYRNLDLGLARDAIGYGTGGVSQELAALLRKLGAA